MRRLAISGLVFIAVVLTARRAAACATCAVGDPTLNVMGVEQPYAGRTRVSAQVRHLEAHSGTPGADEVVSREERLTVALSHAPVPWLTLGLRVPIVLRQTTQPNLSRESVVGPGDTTLRARFVLYRDRTWAPSRLVWAHVGLELPTAPIRMSGAGPLPLERQLGTGSWDPSFAVGGSLFEGALSLHGSVLVFVPTRGSGDSQVGMHLRSTLVGQLQPWTFLGFRLGAGARFEEGTTLAGVDDPNSGGVVGYLSGGLIASPAEDVVLWLTVTVPVIDALRGQQSERVQALAGVAIDV